MNIQHTFRLGLFGGLGVLLALGIGGAISSLATILTYVGAALFLALGLDPLVTFLEKKGLKRPLAIVVVLIGVLAIVTGLVFSLVPVISDQVGNLVKQGPKLITSLQDQSFITGVKESAPWLPVKDLLAQAQARISDPGLLNNLGDGVLRAGIGVATGITGTLIVIILMLYFISSLGSLKRGLAQLVPASKRPSFVDITDQIGDSVGRFVVGQFVLATINGALSFIFLTFIVRVDYSALLAFVAFIGSLIPLVGTVSASVLITLGVLLFNGTPAVFWVGAYYLIYMQVEAYVLNPRIMARAVQVPGVVVVIAALAGGTLLGILGALVAIPVAASIQIIVKQVIVPRQNEL